MGEERECGGKRDLEGGVRQMDRERERDFEIPGEGELVRPCLSVYYGC